MVKFFLMSICALFLSVPVFAGQVDDARDLYLNGEYDAAIDMAMATDTPEGLLVAAETLSAKIMLQQAENPHKSAKKARKWAEEALEALPGSQEALVQYALAYGFETNTSKPFAAWRKKKPQKTLAAVQAIRTQYPDDPRGDALLGAWHLGVIRKTGQKNGEKWFGASEADGIAYYEAALAAAPGDIVMTSNFAMALLAVDVERHFARSIEMLETLSAATANTAAEKEIVTKMAAATTLKGDKTALVNMANAILDNKSSFASGE